VERNWRTNKMDKIEFKNGSVIEPIESDNNTRSKRGQEQLKSAWSIIDDYYNSLPWYKKIITKRPNLP
jgi:hypothetical protein